MSIVNEFAGEFVRTCEQTITSDGAGLEYGRRAVKLAKSVARSWREAEPGISQTGSIGLAPLPSARPSGSAAPEPGLPMAWAAARPASAAWAAPEAASSTPKAAPAQVTKPSPAAPSGGRAGSGRNIAWAPSQVRFCLLYTPDAAAEGFGVELGGRCTH